ncbi:GNAT family N-acetyltransferase [Georgenia subflava]|uniref:GNAT family N-acetyltransferase n=1 Tax=Georgenia subflava TaxID=1622177 RepID=A0A6N7ESP0_9MICO|nr:GNAT family N-acetyltransferase [Georgenia subflava]MPV39116.1 GNAT family N-acetyltransferase [Georgenia subflava]
MSDIRIATTEDLPAYAELVAGAYGEIRDLGINFAAASAGPEQVAVHLTENVVYVLEDAGRLVSSVSVRYPWGPNPGPYGLPHLGWIATAPDRKREGHAQRLVAHVEDEVLRKRLHAPAVSLGTAEHHPWLTAMYTRLGYRETGRTDLGRGHITVYLTKVLDAAAYERFQQQHP